jgi:DNA-binding NarL/FixJ family response regulator
MSAANSILLIDDSAKDRQRYSTTLKALLPDSIIFEAESGQTGLGLFRSVSIHCVILELGLPDQSSIEVLKQLTLAKPSKVPIIVLTRLSYPTILEIAIQMGAAAVLVKSQTSDQTLQDVVLMALSRIPVGQNGLMPTSSQSPLELDRPT